MPPPVLVLFCMINLLQFSVEKPRAHTEYGDVYGTRWSTFNGRQFHVYMSIPYAEKPTEKLRFEVVKEPKTWTEPIDGSIPSPSCKQNSISDVVTGSEDCLYINIFTPNLNLLNVTDLLPVIAFIHGGAFYFFNSLTFGPRYLLDKDIVLVTFNYRLGIFGFLCTEDEISPGNVGMKDQVAALGWIQRNIHYFGGDPSSVTLMGMSAGAASVHYHYFSTLSRGLFHRGIALGGNSFNVWSVQKKARIKANISAAWLACPTSTTIDIVRCLKTAPAQLLAKTVSLFKTKYGPIAPWGPVVDRWSSKPFLTEYPINSIAARNHHNVPLIISDTYDGGLFPAAGFLDDPFSMADLDYEWGAYSHYLLDTIDTIPENLKHSVMDKIRKYYFGRKAIYQNISRFVEMVGNRLYLTGNSLGALYHSTGNPRVFFYVFNFKGKKSSTHTYLGNGRDYGVSHIDDVLYLMNTTENEYHENSPEDVRMIGRLTQMVYNFAKTGKAEYIPGAVWPPLRGLSSPFTYLRIDSPDSATVVSSEDFGDSSFWDSLPLEEPWAGRRA